jgi:hypothetical protein
VVASFRFERFSWDSALKVRLGSIFAVFGDVLDRSDVASSQAPLGPKPAQDSPVELDKHNRPVATRCDKLAANGLGFI